MPGPDEIFERTVTVTAVKPHPWQDPRHSWWEVSASDGWAYELEMLDYEPRVGDQLTVWLRGGAMLMAFRFNDGPIIRLGFAREDGQHGEETD
jgi:hypothetical protein